MKVWSITDSDLSSQFYYLQGAYRVDAQILPLEGHTPEKITSLSWQHGFSSQATLYSGFYAHPGFSLNLILQDFTVEFLFIYQIKILNFDHLELQKVKKSIRSIAGVS